MPDKIVGNILTVGEAAPVKGVDSGESMGTGNSEPIDGHSVVLTVPMSDLKKD